MNLFKYKELLFNKIKVQISDWFEDEAIGMINNEDVYRFLHSIKGTSGTLQLGGLHQITTNLMNTNEQIDKETWTKRELENFLHELIEHSYQCENFYQHEEILTKNRESHVPLIQLIDDDVSMLILLKDAMESKGWMVLANSDPLKAIDQYFDMQPDCLIIDVNLPYKSGFQVLGDIQSHSNKKFVPKVMISIQNDKQTRIQAYQTGADDFIEKPIDIDEFLVRMERHLSRKAIFDQSVLIDELTQVYNRKFLDDTLKRSLNDLRRTGKHFSLAVLDIDFFKKVNDTYGHITGDRVLVAFAKFLKENIRMTDTVFRFGGEEFIVLLPGATDLEAKEILTRLLGNFANIVFTEGNHNFSVTFSAGVYMITDPEVSTLTAINLADSALYEAKNNGRSRVESANLLPFTQSKKCLHVSVIDDDSIIRSLLSNIFLNLKVDGLDLDIQVYENGKKFCQSEKILEKGPHFLILDGNMPEMDGLEVLQNVKVGKKAKDVTVLMLTGRKGVKDITDALRLGADDYVTKPFQIKDLEARILRLINRMGHN